MCQVCSPHRHRIHGPPLRKDAVSCRPAQPRLPRFERVRAADAAYAQPGRLPASVRRAQSAGCLCCAVGWCRGSCGQLTFTEAPGAMQPLLKRMRSEEREAASMDSAICEKWQHDLSEFILKQQSNKALPEKVAAAWKSFMGLHSSLQQGKMMCIDGAMGTQLERAGVSGNDQWNGWPAQLHAPDKVRSVHQSYVDAGADIIITNTYASSGHVMGPTFSLDQVIEANVTAIKLANEVASASKKRVFVAGSISNHAPALPKGLVPKIQSPTATGSWPAPVTETNNYRVQGQAMVDAGVDFIFLEMMKDVDHCKRALEAAGETGYPIFIGFTLGIRQGDGAIVLRDDLLAYAADVISNAPSTVVGINLMHNGINETASFVKHIRETWPGWIGAYPNLGHWVVPDWVFKDLPPTEFVDYAKQFKSNGASLIGGCCGIVPEQITALSQWIASENENKL